jgi:hypothetical protein
MRTVRGNVTGLLSRGSGGGGRALEQWTPTIYGQQRLLVRYQLNREKDGNTLPGAAPVREVCPGLCRVEGLRLENRTHSFPVANRMTPRILVDRVRQQGAEERGRSVPMQGHFDLNCLDQLAAADPEESRVFDLRVFGGLEITLVLGTTRATVRQRKRQY